MWKKILFIFVVVVVAGGAAAWLSKPAPEQRVKTYRIGMVKAAPSVESAVTGFKSEMLKLGYKEGVNVEYVPAEFSQDATTTQQHLKGLIDSQVDLIMVTGVRETQSVKAATAKLAPSLPVVFGVVSDPVGAGIVNSTQSSGNNFTGVTPANEALVSKRTQLLLSLVPGAKRVIIAWNNPNTTGIADLREKVKGFGVEFFEKKVNNVKELEEFLATFKTREGDVYLRASDSVVADKIQAVVDWGIKNKIPVSGTNFGDTQRGAFMSYGANYEAIGFQMARLANRIFSGAKPSELPVEPPGNVELIVNLKTAEKLGITIPPAAMVGVNKFIQ